jgi:hypothetical protein
LTLSNGLQFLAPKTQSENFCVSREGYNLSESVFKIGENSFSPPQPNAKKKSWKPICFTSKANKMT